MPGINSFARSTQTGSASDLINAVNQLRQSQGWSLHQWLSVGCRKPQGGTLRLLGDGRTLAPLTHLLMWGSKMWQWETICLFPLRKQRLVGLDSHANHDRFRFGQCRRWRGTG